MTSSVNPQTANPASNNPAAAPAPSYASAAGAAKKPSPAPVVATGSHQPVVAAGSSAATSHHAKSSSVSPMNGRPNIMPAVPAAVPGAPPVAHGTSNMNGLSDHSHKSSVTMSANGPNSHSANGGSLGNKIQFGFHSPAPSHSSPQPGSAPIPIPGHKDPRVTDPQNSPSPIPPPSASGGRPPSGTAQQVSTMTFGSFGGGDTERPHMRTPSVSQDHSTLGPQNSQHIRRGSNVSDISNQAGPPPGGMSRGNYPGGNRGRGGYNGYQPTGYPPNYRGAQGNQGRGGMPPTYGNRQQPFGTPPTHPRSPAPQAAMPQPPSMPPNMPPNMPPGNMPQFYYQPPAMGPAQVPQNFYPGHFDPNMRPGMPMQPYPMYPMMQGQGQSPVPSYSQPYGPGPYNPPGGTPMSRNSSQVSADHRPASSTGQNQAPVTAQGTPQLQQAQIKPAVVSSPQFTRPKRNAAITIKNTAGETLDFKHLKAPASPVPTSQQSKTPPIVSSTPTPPPKASTPKSSASSHTRADSASNSKTAEEVRNEFKEKMKQAAGGDKAKEEEAAKLAAEKAAEEKLAAEKAAEEKAAEEERLKAEQKAKEEAEAKAAEEAKSKQEAEEKAKAESEAAKAAVAKAEPPKPSDEPDEEELERMIREMEEADAKREKEEEERRVKYEAEKAAKKKAEEANRLANAAENDRKLREAEAEMERLEEEKDRKRAEQNAASVGDLLKGQTSKQPESSTTTASETATKLANLTLNDKPSSAPGAKPSPGGRTKPAALNLAPLKTNSVEPPQPSAALQSLKTARLLDIIKSDIYPPGIQSPNPALNAAVAKKGTSFKYDPAFLLQFKTVFTEQPSLDFHQQVKTLIGDGDGGRSTSARTPAGGSGRQNSRTGAPGFPAMGSFGAPGGRTLPPGTTSAQRFEMSDKAVPRPPMNPIASFQRPGGAFPGGSQMSRTPSTSNMGGMPHSPRQGSRRNASKQSTFGGKSEAQAAKTMPLTAGMKIDGLSTSSTGWKPISIGKSAAASAITTQTGLLDPAMVQRKVKAALNKMTPENFDRISDQILQIAAQSKDETDGRTLRQVIQLTFEKATDEAHWASMYAKFCKRMLEMMSPEIRDENIKDKTGSVVSGGALFRKYLLNRCQEEFERGWKLSLPEKPDEGQEKKTLEAAMLSDEYYIAAAAKRRGLGLVQFIGELYKLGMLTERIMHECVRKLVDYSGVPDEAEVESLSKLLRTIGANLDATEKGRLMMDAYFQRIQGMMDLPDLPSRLQFMLLDVVDLRKANWVSKETNKGPKTLEEVRAEAEAQAAQKAAENARSNQRGGPGGRSHMGRSDARNFSSGFPQPTPNQIGIEDLRRLKNSTNRTSSGNVTLGPMSMLNSRSNSGRRLGPGSSLSRGAEDSAASSRTGTPPVRETQSSTNSFGLLANMDSDHPASPPSTAASPALAKATPETTASAGKGSG